MQEKPLIRMTARQARLAVEELRGHRAFTVFVGDKVCVIQYRAVNSGSYWTVQAGLVEVEK